MVARSILLSARPADKRASRAATGRNTAEIACARAFGTSDSPVITITGRKMRSSKFIKIYDFQICRAESICAANAMFAEHSGVIFLHT